MLKLINICKSFKYGKNKNIVLDNINLDFKKKELVFILGSSGSGKSTLLNIIGGLLEPDSGNILLDDKDVTKFNNKTLNYYRNNMIGFIYQDYHLIEYMSVIDNIKLGQTITNTNNNIDNILIKLGIYNKRKTIVNKLSGGEKQRVAIARAIINNPDILLCDEPTGALDSTNSEIIMKILKELSKEKLVIVVTHDQTIANKYGDRFINIKDGKVEYLPLLDDGLKFQQIKKSKINISSIIKLAFKNLSLKKGRTLFTSLAISLGFICILLVLCLSKCFSSEINNIEKEYVSIFPISIYNGEYENINDNNQNNNYNSNDNIIIKKDKNNYVYENKIDKNLINYISKIEEISYINYQYDTSLPIISDKYKMLDIKYFKALPNINLIKDNYNLVYGNNINSKYEVLLKIDSNNQVDEELLKVFNINDNPQYTDLIGRKLKIILNDEYYIKNGDYYYINNNLEEMYKKSTIELTIVGIVKELNIVDNDNYFYYDKTLLEDILSKNKDSKIVLEQINKDYNILGLNINKDDLLSYLGYETLPYGINIYVSNLSNKNTLIKKLDEYNIKNNKIIYTDTMKDAIDILNNVINIITVILIIFSTISIIVSSMMVFMLTNNRILERTKEIGILRGLGASKKDVIRLFNIENIIIGSLSSLIGIIFLHLISQPINNLLSATLEVKTIFSVYNNLAIICIVFNILIVVISGYIPIKKVSRKNIIDCIYNRI